MHVYSQEYSQIKEMIRRFDEIISEKASKVAINELEYFIENHYVKKKYWDKL
jgi:hypothetical protein